MKIILINGPNLNFLKKREKIYSNFSFKKIKKKIIFYSKNKLKIIFFNSNCEGKIINFIQKNLNIKFLLINPGAYSHTSIALLDCLKVYKGVLIEIHISNIYNRDFFRKNSLISLRSNLIISGMGIQGYFHSIDYIINYDYRN
ncbi:3-dehydroquinate dehydratase [Candidatus Carsonella ruddii CS isolate Thao2000]|uniref:3-dehydroquinate dehydratase n=1 Tax=Candidatus Carsonella ruddii CS isolate Thao2000 TaxID=1202537 RepID=J7GW74_CARRU|nr:type II 3-dehydroquinate dehydratase [Candidatus Carsonella ruddii]AFP83676.1 3-dehydroquinate dehydratase [Candidatus Carsonella ruddii CS isolate Thao2000]